jgi:hypothetical protein
MKHFVLKKKKKIELVGKLLKRKLSPLYMQNARTKNELSMKSADLFAVLSVQSQPGRGLALAWLPRESSTENSCTVSFMLNTMGFTV